VTGLPDWNHRRGFGQIGRDHRLQFVGNKAAREACAGIDDFGIVGFIGPGKTPDRHARSARDKASGIGQHARARIARGEIARLG